MADVTAEPAAQEQPSLKRVMGPWLLLLFVVGDILGRGQVTATMDGISWSDEPFEVRRPAVAPAGPVTVDLTSVTCFALASPATCVRR